MAEFDQPKATQRALQQAVLAQQLGGMSRQEAAAFFGVTTRTIDRWKTSAKEQRSPGKAAQTKFKPPGAVKLKLDATITVGGDPKYRRRRTGIQVAFTAAEAQQLFDQALRAPDEAWQTFFDVYVMPAGVIEQPRIRFD